MVQIVSWRAGRIKETEDLASFAKEPKEGLYWLDLSEAAPGELDHLARVLDLHPVTREALSRSTNRPRLMDYGRYFSLTIYVPGGHLAEPHSHEIDIVVGTNWIVTVHEKKIKGLLGIQELCRRRPEIMSRGSDFFLQEMLDTLLERFFPLLEWFDERIGRLEDEVTKGYTAEKLLNRVAELRRAISGLRRTMVNQREVIARLARSEVKLIRLENQPYYRDLYEQIMRAADSVDDARERLIMLREMHMNQVSNRMNAVMKVLTVWATIFLPLTFLAGVWGMNFRFMPELAQPWGYWSALGVMAAVAIVMIFFFKRKRWL